MGDDFIGPNELEVWHRDPRTGRDYFRNRDKAILSRAT
jgi:hypothetical protein